MGPIQINLRFQGGDQHISLCSVGFYCAPDGQELVNLPAGEFPCAGAIDPPSPMGAAQTHWPPAPKGRPGTADAPAHACLRRRSLRSDPLVYPQQRGGDHPYVVAQAVNVVARAAIGRPARPIEGGVLRVPLIEASPVPPRSGAVALGEHLPSLPQGQ
jgi:hypothetical protein